MFKDEPKEETFEEDVETIVGNSVSLEGEFSSEGSIAINGKVMGKVTTQKNIDVGDEAEVKADLEGKDIIVSGSVEGNVKAERLEIKENGEVSGDIETQVLLIAEGAKFSGNCKMGEGGEEQKGKEVPEREEKEKKEGVSVEIEEK